MIFSVGAGVFADVKGKSWHVKDERKKQDTSFE